MFPIPPIFLFFFLLRPSEKQSETPIEVDPLVREIALIANGIPRHVDSRRSWKIKMRLISLTLILTSPLVIQALLQAS